MVFVAGVRIFFQLLQMEKETHLLFQGIQTISNSILEICLEDFLRVRQIVLVQSAKKLEFLWFLEAEMYLMQWVIPIITMVHLCQNLEHVQIVSLLSTKVVHMCATRLLGEKI